MKRILPLLIPFLLLSFTGCDQEDPNSCDYWVKRLANPSKAREALQQVGMMKCDEAGDTLKAMFDEGRNRTEILAAAEQFDDKTVVVDLLKKALRIKDISKSAANMIGDMKLVAAKPVLEEVLASGRNAEVRGPGLKALLSMTDDPADIEGILLKVLKADPSIQGAEATKVAAEALGKIRSEKAIPHLIVSLFAGTTDPSLMSIYRTVRAALADIGAPAAKPAVKPDCAQFSSGPCKKRPGYTVGALADAWADPDALRAFDVTLQDVFRAVRDSNVDVGARTIEVNRAEYVVRGLGRVRDGAPLKILARDRDATAGRARGAEQPT